jgi:hypothetical protein
MDPYPVAAVLFHFTVGDRGVPASLGQHGQCRLEVPAYEIGNDVHAVGTQRANALREPAPIGNRLGSEGAWSEALLERPRPRLERARDPAWAATDTMPLHHWKLSRGKHV